MTHPAFQGYRWLLSAWARRVYFVSICNKEEESKRIRYPSEADFAANHSDRLIWQKRFRDLSRWNCTFKRLPNSHFSNKLVTFYLALSGRLDLSACVGADNPAFSAALPHAMETNLIIQGLEIRFSHLNAASVKHWFEVYYWCARWPVFWSILISCPSGVQYLSRGDNWRKEIRAPSCFSDLDVAKGQAVSPRAFKSDYNL